MNFRLLSFLGVIVLLSIVVYKLILSPFSLTFEVADSEANGRQVNILTDSSAPVLLTVFQVNRVGFKIPFAHLDGKFVVTQGADKIDIIREGGDNLVFRTRSEAGVLVILYYTPSMAFPLEITLRIQDASLAQITYSYSI